MCKEKLVSDPEDSVECVIKCFKYCTHEAHPLDPICRKSTKAVLLCIEKNIDNKFDLRECLIQLCDNLTKRMSCCSYMDSMG